MTLQEAWYKLIGIKNSESMSSKLVYSYLNNYGVFISFPKLRLAVKTALDYGIWELVTSICTATQISILKTKLENDGFAEDVIEDIILSFTSNPQNTPSNKAHTDIQKIHTSNICSLKQIETIIPFTIKRAIDENITSEQTNEKFKLNTKLFIVPTWNLKANIIIHKINILEETLSNPYPLNSYSYTRWNRDHKSKKFSLSYNITSDFDSNQTRNHFSSDVTISTLTIAQGRRIHSKNIITTINLSDKYAVSSGDYKFEIDLPIE